MKRTLVAWRRDFHQYPETGFDLERTAGIVAQELEAMGLKVKRGVGRSGVVADLVVPGARRCIALRADMDALPIQEENGASYASKVPGKAHLCGHDAHTAILLGAANLLQERRTSLPMNVRFLFQPCEEEWPGGAREMIKEGALKGVDEVYGLHVWPTLDVGHFGICVGPAMAQADGFTIAIKGKGGHAATPHKVVNPIGILAHVVHALEALLPSVISSSDEAVLTLTKVQAGSTYNVVEELGTLGGTVRCFDVHVQETIKRRMKEVVEGIVSAYGATYTFQYLEGFPPVVNDAEKAAYVKEVAASIVGDERVHFPGRRALFGEDFAYYVQEVKGAFIQLGCRNPSNREAQQMLHHPRFDIDEECLLYGAELFTRLIIGR